MDLFAVGEIVKTRGLHGCLKVLSYLETENAFSKLEFLYIERNAGQSSRFDIKKISLSGKFLFIEFEGISDIDTAAKLIGCKILLPRDILKKLPEGQYYWHEIIGLDVYTEDDRYIGKVTSIFSTGSNDVYVCKGEKREILLPAISEVIRQIDMDRHVMKVHLLKGL
jgi:16S rRNA processing protein RimM